MGCSGGLQLGLLPCTGCLQEIAPSASSSSSSSSSLVTPKQTLPVCPSRSSRRRRRVGREQFVCPRRRSRSSGRGRGCSCNSLLESCGSLVLADMDPSSMQTVILTAGVVTATGISLFFGLKVGFWVLSQKRGLYMQCELLARIW